MAPQPGRLVDPGYGRLLMVLGPVLFVALLPWRRSGS